MGMRESVCENADYSNDRIVSLGKLAKHLFPATHAVPLSLNTGDVFYIVGVMLAVILWGFAIVWFVVAVIMIAVSGKFPFNMGWWGFIFPVGESLVSFLSLCPGKIWGLLGKY